MRACSREQLQTDNNLLRTDTLLCDRERILNPLKTFTCYLRLWSCQKGPLRQCGRQELLIDLRPELVRHDFCCPDEFVWDTLGETLEFPAHKAGPHRPHQGQQVCRKVFEGNVVADLGDKLLALGLAHNVDACVQRADSDGVGSGRDPVLVVHGVYNVLHNGRAVVVEYFGST
jgi:hypothetical protein